MHIKFIKISIFRQLIKIHTNIFEIRICDLRILSKKKEKKTFCSII